MCNSAVFQCVSEGDFAHPCFLNSFLISKLGLGHCFSLTRTLTEALFLVFWWSVGFFLRPNFWPGKEQFPLACLMETDLTFHSGPES